MQQHNAVNWMPVASSSTTNIVYNWYLIEPCLWSLLRCLCIVDHAASQRDLTHNLSITTVSVCSLPILYPQSLVPEKQRAFIASYTWNIVFLSFTIPGNYFTLYVRQLHLFNSVCQLNLQPSDESCVFRACKVYTQSCTNTSINQSVRCPIRFFPSHFYFTLTFLPSTPHSVVWWGLWKC